MTWISVVVPWVTSKPSRVGRNGFFQCYRNSVAIEIFSNDTTLG